MQQSQLFDPSIPAARATDPQSSHEAAERVTRTGARQNQAEAVLEALKTYPGSTSRELAERAGLDRHLVARRLPDLEHANTARQGELRACCYAGRSAVTWWLVKSANQNEE